MEQKTFKALIIVSLFFIGSKAHSEFLSPDKTKRACWDLYWNQTCGKAMTPTDGWVGIRWISAKLTCESTGGEECWEPCTPPPGEKCENQCEPIPQFWNRQSCEFDSKK